MEKISKGFARRSQRMYADAGTVEPLRFEDANEMRERATLGGSVKYKIFVNSSTLSELPGEVKEFAGGAQ